MKSQSESKMAQMMAQMDFTDFLEDIRKSIGFSQKKFAELLNVDDAVYYSFKTGRTLMSEDTLNSIIKALDEQGIHYSGRIDFPYKGATKIQPGMKFGRLTTIQPDGIRKSDGCIYWVCKCECGKQTRTTSYQLRSGNTSSCGCNKERQRKAVSDYNKEHKKEIAERARKNYPKVSLKIGMIEQTNLSYVKNAKVRKDNTTGVRGVTIDKKTGKYKATLIFQKSIYRLGTFDNLLDAKKARERAEDNIQDEIKRLEMRLKELNIKEGKA